LKPVKDKDLSPVHKRINTNKYSGNYGYKANKKPFIKRGMSLERCFALNKISNDNTSLLRAQSQTFFGSSSEESYTSSRPQSGDTQKNQRSKNTGYLSSDDSHSQEKFYNRDYTKPLPPCYRKTFSSNDSAYSSHNSEK